MPHLPKLFLAAIEKGVHDIAGGEKLKAPEKRQLLAILRKRGDCPDGWKNIAPEKQRNILGYLGKKIARLLNPEEFAEKQRAIYDRYAKRRSESGQRKPMHRPFWKTKTTRSPLGMKTHSKKKQPKLLK